MRPVENINCQYPGCKDTFLNDIQRGKHNLVLAQMVGSHCSKLNEEIYSLIKKKTGKKKKYPYLRTTEGKIMKAEIYLCPTHKHYEKALNRAGKVCLNICEFSEKSQFFVKPFTIKKKELKTIRAYKKSIRKAMFLIQNEEKLINWMRGLAVLFSILISKYIKNLK